MALKPSWWQVLIHPIKTALQFGTQSPWQHVKVDTQSYQARTPTWRIVKKFFHKFLYLAIHGHLPLWKVTAPSKGKILWIYVGKNSFGDANLELAGRALLKGLSYEHHMLVQPKLLALFAEDDVFSKIYTDTKEIQTDFDHVVIPELNHRSLRTKVSIAPRTSFTSMFGLFDGPPRDQASFSYAGVNQAFRLGLCDEDISSQAKPYTSNKAETLKAILAKAPKTSFICMSVGGVDPYRTYQQWHKVLALLDKGEITTQIVLVGSDNGLTFADELSSKSYAHLKVHSQVNKLSLLETRALLSKASLFVGCDGGLMHLAHSAGTPSVAIFSNTEPYDYWTTPACRCHALQSDGSASDVSAERVAHAVMSTIKSFDPHKL
jgi:heptosyltransferase-2